MIVKGKLVMVENYRLEERKIHALLVGQENYNSDFYCGANGIDIQTIDGNAVIPCIELFDKFLNSKGIVFDNLNVELMVNDMI